MVTSQMGGTESCREEDRREQGGCRSGEDGMDRGGGGVMESFEGEKKKF